MNRFVKDFSVHRRVLLAAHPVDFTGKKEILPEIPDQGEILYGNSERLTLKHNNFRILQMRHLRMFFRIFKDQTTRYGLGSGGSPTPENSTRSTHAAQIG